MQEIPTFKFALREDLRNDERFLPTKGEPLATGWDVRAALDTKSITISPGEYVKIPLGFRTFCPEGWWFELRPRSSTHGKKNLHCLYGVVDSSYEGQLILSVQYLPPFEYAEVLTNENIGYSRPSTSGVLSHNSMSSSTKTLSVLSQSRDSIRIDHGEALGQIIPVRRQEMKVDAISNEEFDRLCKERGAVRGAGSFGSTDKK